MVKQKLRIFFYKKKNLEYKTLHNQIQILCLFFFCIIRFSYHSTSLVITSCGLPRDDYLCQVIERGIMSWNSLLWNMCIKMVIKMLRKHFRVSSSVIQDNISFLFFKFSFLGCEI